MVWEWLSPRSLVKEREVKENAELDNLSPVAPACGNCLTACSGGRVSGTIEMVPAVRQATAAAVGLFVEHEVQRGDCLYDIGRKHNVDLSSLLEANPRIRNPDSLWIGITIKIPYTSSTAHGVPPRQMQSSLKGQDQWKMPVKPSCFSIRPETLLTLSNALLLLGSMFFRIKEHKVVEGDSLYHIAEKYGTSVSAIKRFNNLKDDVIYAGSILKIESSQRRKPLEGRKLSVRERNALLEGILITLPQPIQAPTLVNPSFNMYPLLQRGQHLTPPPSLKTVKVKFGDTIADIAYAHGLGIQELQDLNNLRDDIIYEGDSLVVSPSPVKRRFLELRVGQRRTRRMLFSRHGESRACLLAVDSDISVSKAKHFPRGRWERKKKGFQCQGKRLQFSSPLVDGFVSSPFGWRWGAFHEGVDIAAEKGAPILASDEGTVSFAGWRGGYGNLLAIQHAGGFITRYAHCCAIHAHVGQQVMKGQQVAAVGATGHATGPHLHFEVRRNGEALDPFKWADL